MALTGGMTELKKIETLGWIAKIKILIVELKITTNFGE
jgi:hypothetical protein